MLKDLVLQCRSYRRFYEEVGITEQELLEIVDIGRLTASSANSQALKFKIVWSQEENKRVFDTLAWAGALPKWHGPQEGERPSAYIIILNDFSLGKNKSIDDGIVAQTMLLAATEMGYGGCLFGSIRRQELAKAFAIDLEKYSIDLVLALGKPKEIVKLVAVGEDGATTYYRDQDQIHCVPKRSLSQVLL